MADFKKVVMLGTGKTYGGRGFKTFAKIEFKSGKLSICGVEGPRKSGNCTGSCGQIDMGYKENPGMITPGPGWTRAKLDKFMEIWDKWHLNDMRSGCEHQRAENWGKKTLIIVHYDLSRETWEARRKIEAKVQQGIREQGKAEIAPHEQEILNLPLSLCYPGEDIYERDVSLANLRNIINRYYTEKKRENKLSTGIYEHPEDSKFNSDNEFHPEGVLCKPCPVCGHKFGTGWLKEEVPEDVLKFLRALPNSPVVPAWV